MNDAEIHIPSYKNTEPLVTGNQVYQSLYDFTLTEKDLERARTELGETDEIKKACLRKLREKLLNDKSVKYRLDDSYLLRFLRTRKYDVLKAYQNMKNIYEMRNKHQDFFTLHNDLKSIQQLSPVTLSPYIDEEGRLVFFYNAERWNLSEISLDKIGTTVINVNDVIFKNPKLQINGAVVIFDSDGLSWKHLSEFLRPGPLWMFLTLSTNAYPVRIKKVIVINTNRYFRSLLNVAKPFLRRKISDRVILLGSDMNDLHQHVNPALLPKRLNGSLEEEEFDMSQIALDNLPYIRYERSFKSSK